MNKWREEYKKLLFDRNVSYQDCSKFAKSYLPSSLFRYRRFDSHWEENIFNGEVYFSSSSNLNDPFDCLTYVDLIRYKEHIYEQAKVELCGFCDEKDIHTYFKEHGTEQIEKENWNIREKISVACFSDNVVSPLMWAHYTDSHKGFCIEYKTERIEDPILQMILPVIYENKRYDATDDVISRNMNTILNPYFIKSMDWNYENEWRIVLTERILSRIGRSADFGDKMVGIYFGIESYRNYPKEVEKIVSWARDRGVKLYKMKIHPEKYSIYPDEL